MHYFLCCCCCCWRTLHLWYSLRSRKLVSFMLVPGGARGQSRHSGDSLGRLCASAVNHRASCHRLTIVSESVQKYLTKNWNISSCSCTGSASAGWRRPTPACGAAWARWCGTCPSTASSRCRSRSGTPAAGPIRGVSKVTWHRVPTNHSPPCSSSAAPASRGRSSGWWWRAPPRGPAATPPAGPIRGEHCAGSDQSQLTWSSTDTERMKILDRPKAYSLALMGSSRSK